MQAVAVAVSIVVLRALQAEQQAQVVLALDQEQVMAQMLHLPTKAQAVAAQVLV
jgi:hypothetical protein